jgi:hypothetical protein
MPRRRDESLAANAVGIAIRVPTQPEINRTLFGGNGDL